MNLASMDIQGALKMDELRKTGESDYTRNFRNGGMVNTRNGSYLCQDCTGMMTIYRGNEPCWREPGGVEGFQRGWVRLMLTFRMRNIIFFTRIKK